MRHPLYVFSLLVIWFMPTMTDTFLTLNIGITLYFLIGSRIEERRMITEYGDDYQQYRQQVPWMLPDISRMFQDARAALSDRTAG
jgi:protein-S-isoprenylcysteine O-methyltransferase Ste14